jgi:hypothetical protein
VTFDTAAAVCIACCIRVDLMLAWSDPMQTPVRTDRSTDHPTREPADHANLDPRRTLKHPKIAVRGRSGGERTGRPSSR